MIRRSDLNRYLVRGAAVAKDISDLPHKLNRLSSAFGVLPPVATRTAILASGSYSNGSDTASTYRITHLCPPGAMYFRLVYTNYLITGSSTEVGPGNAITVTAGFEYGSSTYQVLFNGATSVVIPDGGTAISDPIPVLVAVGGTLYTRSGVAVSAEQKWPLGLQSRSGQDTRNSTSDVTTGTGALSAASGQYFFGPSAILGVPTTDKPGVLLIGDSITQGTGDSPDNGWAIRGLNNQFGYIQSAKASTSAGNWMVNANLYQRLKIYPSCKYAVLALGHNDLSGADAPTLITRLQTIAAYLSAVGVRVYPATMPPYTTSSDYWQTVGNQTVTAYESRRTSVNDSIRSILANCAGYIDLAAAVEVNAANTLTINGGFWKTAAALDSGTATAGASASLTDSGKVWATNAYATYSVTITGGTGAGQTKNIASNTGTVLTLDGTTFSPAPDVTSTYIISANPTGDGIHPTQYSHIAMAAKMPLTSFV